LGNKKAPPKGGAVLQFAVEGGFEPPRGS